MITQQNDGFSSNSEIIQEKIIHQRHQTNYTRKQDLLKHKIPPGQQLRDKSYSLIPDMFNGQFTFISWIPKVPNKIPIPLLYQSGLVDYLIHLLSLGKMENYHLVYIGKYEQQGPRHQNTYFCYENKEFQNPYKYIIRPQPRKRKIPFLGMNPDFKEYIFNSDFECGNLDLVIKNKLTQQYDLYIRVDTNTRGHCQWYNFLVCNKKKGTIKLNILNIQKSKTLYARVIVIIIGHETICVIKKKIYAFKCLVVANGQQCQLLSEEFKVSILFSIVF